MPIRKRRSKTRNFLGQHEAESQEAGTAHRLLAKAREGLYVSEKNNRSLAVKEYGLWRYEPWLHHKNHVILANISVPSSVKREYLLYEQHNVA